MLCEISSTRVHLSFVVKHDSYLHFLCSKVCCEQWDEDNEKCAGRETGFFFEPNCQTAKLRARNVKRKSEIKGLTCLIKTHIANAIVFIQNNKFIIQTN